PTPAGNSAACIALLRLHGYTNEASYHEKAEKTLKILAGVAGQYGLFPGTYGIAAVHLPQPHKHVIVVGQDERAHALYEGAVASYEIGKAVLQIGAEKAVAENLPPALADTIPQLPVLKEGRSAAILCADFACRAPIFDLEKMNQELQGRKSE